MKRTWILFTTATHAMLFENRGLGVNYHKVDEFEHPESRLRNREIVSDKPGRNFQSTDGRRSSYEGVDHKEELIKEFAHELALYLNKGRAEQAFDELLLVSEPRFLGYLKEYLDKKTASMLRKSVNKSLTDPDDKKIEQLIKEVL